MNRVCNNREKELMNEISIDYDFNRLCHSTIVDIIIPLSLKAAFKVLCSKEARKCAGVLPENEYVFPNVRHTKGSASGYHDMAHNKTNEICSKFKIEESVTATGIRHWLSIVDTARK